MRTTTKGLKDGFTRHTLEIKEDHLKMIKALAFYNRESIGETLTNLLNQASKNIKDKDIKEALKLYNAKKEKSKK